MVDVPSVPPVVALVVPVVLAVKVPVVVAALPLVLVAAPPELLLLVALVRLGLGGSGCGSSEHAPATATTNSACCQRLRFQVSRIPETN